MGGTTKTTAAETLAANISAAITCSILDSFNSVPFTKKLVIFCMFIYAGESTSGWSNTALQSSTSPPS